MLDDLHRDDEVEARQVERGQIAAAIIDGQPLPCRMVARYGDILWRGIDAGDAAAQPRQRLGEQSRAAADIDHRPTVERAAFGIVDPPMMVDRLADITQPYGVEPVEHRRRSPGIPPVGGELAEMLRFAFDDRGHLLAFSLACALLALCLSAKA